MTDSQILLLALLGAVLGLDVVSFPQAMLSRPIVAATLSGALLGDATGGLLAGAALELVALETLPVGASRYPEWGSASVVGGAIVAYYPDRAGALSVSLLAAIAVGWIGGWTMVELRTLNARWAKRLRPAIDSGERSAVVGLQLAGLATDFVRGFLLTWVALLAFRPLGRAVLGVWGADARVSRAVAVTVAASVGAAAVWKLFRVTEHARWFLVGGLALGLASMALR